MEHLRTSYYCVAGHYFRLTMPENEPAWLRMSQYHPFESGACEEGQLIFSLGLVREIDTDGAVSIFKDTPEEGQPPVEILRKDDLWLVKTCSTIQAAPDWKKAVFTINSQDRLFSVNNALMLMYAFSTSGLATLEMHASVVSKDGYAYLFLAKSGTGKSTQSRMWLESIPGTELVNDDNPIVRVFPDGNVRVYGSPWSGKTPCYRNVEYPVGGFVRIRRAAFNKCTRLSNIEGYALVYSSSSGFKADRKMGDNLHDATSRIVLSKPCYVLDCLPDHDAAATCYNTVRWITE